MYIFVYGSLKSKCSNHNKLKNTKFICVSKTAKMYTMLDFNEFPAVVHIDGNDENPISKSHINGEVYEVDYDTLKCLDEFEGIWFTRKMVVLECGISVWMYFLNTMPTEYKIVKNGMWGS